MHIPVLLFATEVCNEMDPVTVVRESDIRTQKPILIISKR